MTDDGGQTDFHSRIDAALADRPSTRPSLWRLVQENRHFLKLKLEEGYTYADIAEALRAEGYSHASAQNVGAAFRAKDAKKQVKRNKNVKASPNKSANIPNPENIKADKVAFDGNFTAGRGERVLGEMPNTIGKNYYG